MPSAHSAARRRDSPTPPTTMTTAKRRRVTTGPLHELTKAKRVVVVVATGGAGDGEAAAAVTVRASGRVATPLAYDFTVAARGGANACKVLTDVDARRATPKSARVGAWIEVARARGAKRVRKAFRESCERAKIEAPPQLAFERWRFATKLYEDAVRAKGFESGGKRVKRGMCGVTGEGADALLPNVAHDGVTAGALGLDLMRAGLSKIEAIAIEVAVHQASSREVEKLEKIKQKYVDGGASGVAKLASATMTAHKRSRDLSLDDCFVKVTHEAYDKLRALHANYARDGDGRESGEGVDDDTFHDRMFALLLRYKTIHGHGFQAACSPDVFRVLHEMLQVTMECFASPMNTYFARHCSAFGDVDSAFGSVGSFAAFKPARGAYEVNPPFVAAVLDEAATWCEALLERAELAKQPLTFVYVMPGWKETRAFATLTASAFLRASVLIAAADHGYCDGASHQRRDPYRQSPYDTCVFVLRTSRAAASDATAFDPVAFDAAVRVAMRVAVPTTAQAKRQNRPQPQPLPAATTASASASASSSSSSS